MVFSSQLEGHVCLSNKGQRAQSLGQQDTSKGSYHTQRALTPAAERTGVFALLTDLAPSYSLQDRH